MINYLKINAIFVDAYNTMNYKTKIQIMKNVLNFLALSVLLILSSCGSIKTLTYLQDMEYNSPYLVKDVPSVRIQEDDKLSIVVSCSNQELAAPFNGGVLSVNVETGSTSVSGKSELPEYVVSKEGTINFPILGVLYVKNMTLDELCRTIEDRIKSNNLISDPSVKVDFTNFQITIIGESGAGIYPVSNNKINLIDALAMAGDLPTSAKRDDVMVIRTENGARTAYSVDLRSVELFESPVFYLKQNDVIYIKPNKYKSDGRTETVYRYISLAMSMASIVTTVLVYLNLK